MRIGQLARLSFTVFILVTVFLIICRALQGGLIFVCGSREGLMEVSGRRHNTDDIIATVLAVEPMKFIYRGRLVNCVKLFKLKLQ